VNYFCPEFSTTSPFSRKYKIYLYALVQQSVLGDCLYQKIRQAKEHREGQYKIRKHAVAQLVEATRYKPEGRGFDPDGVIGIFH
jgi:hypothetical protein